MRKGPFLSQLAANPSLSKAEQVPHETDPISMAGKANTAKCANLAVGRTLCRQGAPLKAFVLQQSIPILTKQMSYKGASLEGQSLSFPSSLILQNKPEARGGGMMLWVKS